MKEKTSPLQKALNLWAIILIIWSIYRSQFKLPEWFDELIAKPLIFIFPVYLYIKKIEKRNFFDAISLKMKSIYSNIILGLFAGAIFFASVLAANFIKSRKIIFFNQNGIYAQNIIFTLIIVFATSISEEILSRGFILKRLYKESKNLLSSSFFASILFFFLHIPILFTNAKITGNFLLLFMTTDLIFSLTTSLVFLTSESLILPIFIHAFYNLAFYLFL